jgi:hypothetical protein
MSAARMPARRRFPSFMRMTPSRGSYDGGAMAPLSSQPSAAPLACIFPADPATHQLQADSPRQAVDVHNASPCPNLAQMRSADRARERPLSGADRTQGEHHETDAPDPERTSASIWVYTHLIPVSSGQLDGGSSFQEVCARRASPITEQRRLAVIVSADVAGYSRQTARR